MARYLERATSSTRENKGHPYSWNSFLLCEWDAFSTRTKVRFFGESQAKWYIYIYVWYIHRLRSTSLDTYAAVYTRSMATPFPFFSTRHRFIRLPVWKKIARPRTSFWTTDTFTDFFHGSLRFRKRFKPTSSRHFRTSNLTFVSIFDPSSIFLFLFFFFFFFLTRDRRSKRRNRWMDLWARKFLADFHVAHFRRADKNFRSGATWISIPRRDPMKTLRSFHISFRFSVCNRSLDLTMHNFSFERIFNF